MEKNKNYVKQIFKIDVGNIPENEVEDYVRNVAVQFSSGTDSRYLEIIPDSHYWTDLNHLLNLFESRPEMVTPEYLSIGLRNTKENGYKLKVVDDEATGFVPYIFGDIDGMIKNVERKEFIFEDFVQTIKNTLLCGINLTNGLNMERQEIYNRIDGERDYQDANWGSRKQVDGISDEEKPVAEWINYIEYHISRAKNCVYYLDTKGATDELRNVAALAVRAMEIHGCPERIAKVDIAPNCCSPDCDCKKGE